MNILIYSHLPYHQTGFGKVVQNLVNHLKKNHKIYCLPIIGREHGVIEHDGYTVLTCPGSIKMSEHWVSYWAKNLNIDVVIQHFDVWMLSQDATKPNWINDIPCPVITYAPVDCDPLPFNFKEACKGAAVNVAMSRHAERLFKENNMKTVYIPHGVDLSVYQKIENARQFVGLPEDKFIVGIVQTNGSLRKNLGGQICAFAKFAKAFPDSLLYLHTQVKKVNPEGLDIVPFVKKLGISDKVVFTDPETYALGIDESFMPYLYSSFDVLMQCSLGEGFGLPIIEAQACGTPVIGTNCSAISELVNLTCNGTPLFLNSYNSNVVVPKQEEMFDALAAMHNQWDAQETSAYVRRPVESYSWENIFSSWDKLLDSM